MKLVGALLIVLGGIFGGARMVYDLGRRRMLLLELKKALLMIRSEIQYAATEFPELCLRIAEQTTEPVQSVFKTVGQQLLEKTGESPADIWENTCCAQLEKEGLSVEDGRWLRRMQELFLIQERAIQLGCIDLYLEQLEGRAEEAGQRLKQNGKIAYCVGTMGGLLIAIMLF